MYEYLIGKRIRLLDIKNNVIFGKFLKAGNLGTVNETNTINIESKLFTKVWISFDNGVSLALLTGIDSFQVL